METRLIIPLEEIQESDAAMVGGKAYGLARLIHLGLSVPRGFCITADSYREHIISTNIVSQLSSALVGLENAPSDKKQSVLSDIRQVIIEGPVCEELTERISNHSRRLKAGYIAVRSSATAEDLPSHSFAGQYETYLGITDMAGCIDAVKKCWASLWTERAYEYRQKNGFDHLAVNMAVIVQLLVEADTSGVIFTADPVNGYKSRIIIETVPGLGDSLVSGKATPQRFVVAKKKYRIVSKNLTSDSYITDSVVKRLAKRGKKVEKHFGSPQDIEWAISDNKIFFLQSRPITAVPQKKSWEERQVWTNANTGEVLPDVLTPLTMSLIQLLFDRLLDQTFTLTSIKLGNNQLYSLVGGRVYVNINTGIGVLKCFPILRNLDFHSALGGEQSKMADFGQLDIPEEDTPKLEFSLGKMMLKVPGIVFHVLTYKPKKGKAMILEVKNRSIRLQGLDISGMSKKTLAKSFVAEVIDLENFMADARIRPGILYTIIGIVSLQMLGKVCIRWFGDDGNTFANRLLVGLGNMDDAEAGLDLWRLAQKAHEIAEVEKAIISGNDWNPTRKMISEVVKGEQFLESWDEFMSRHGHHCRGEMEVFNARWAETPDYILSIVRNYIRGIKQAEPLENYNRYAQQRKELAQLCRKRLKNPIKRAIFNYLLTHAQGFIPIRENSKSDFARIITIWRNMLLELGRRLNNSKILSDAEDIFFLRLEEIEPVTQGNADFDIKKAIVSRRAEYEKNNSVMPPKVVIGKFNPDDYTPDAVNTNVEILNGLAVSSGVVTGKARVILKADTNEQVLPGEILVAPFTDPGWTPYFMPAAAIVMDIGGMLSHGSIIAREYGIPAVVNVGPATKIIKTGQTIQVDANRGIVRIIK
ncbi:MAG: PEP/pyruvate-binding domain-containing protein [Planctomycetota bacterium]|jgi:pyruvate,water dikinase